MNWMGGARNRVRWHGERKLQKDFFDRKRLEAARSFLPRTPNSRNKVSQDLKALHTVSRTHSSFKNENIQRKLIKSVDMDTFQSCTRKVDEVDLGPTSPVPASCKLFIADDHNKTRPIPQIDEELPFDRRNVNAAITDHSISKEAEILGKPRVSVQQSAGPSSQSKSFTFTCNDNNKDTKQLPIKFDPYASEDFQLTPLVHYGQKKKLNSKDFQPRKLNMSHHHPYHRQTSKKKHQYEEPKLSVESVGCSYERNVDKIEQSGRSRVLTSTPQSTDQIMYNNEHVFLSASGRGRKLSPILERSFYSPVNEDMDTEKFKFKPHWTASISTSEHISRRKSASSSLKSPTESQATSRFSYDRYGAGKDEDSYLYSNGSPNTSTTWQLKTRDISCISDKETTQGNTASSHIDLWRTPNPNSLNNDSFIDNYRDSFEPRIDADKSNKDPSSKGEYVSGNTDALMSSGNLGPQFDDVDDFRYHPYQNKNSSNSVVPANIGMENMYRTISHELEGYDGDRSPMKIGNQMDNEFSKKSYQSIAVKLEDVIEEINQLENEDEDDQQIKNQKISVLNTDGETDCLTSVKMIAERCTQDECADELLLNSDLDHFQEVNSPQVNTSRLNETVSSVAQKSSQKATIPRSSSVLCHQDAEIRTDNECDLVDMARISSNPVEVCLENMAKHRRDTVNDLLVDTAASPTTVDTHLVDKEIATRSINGHLDEAAICTIISEPLKEHLIDIELLTVNQHSTDKATSPTTFQENLVEVGLSSVIHTYSVKKLSDVELPPVPVQDISQEHMVNVATSPVSFPELSKKHMVNVSTSPVSFPDRAQKHMVNVATSPVSYPEYSQVHMVDEATSPMTVKEYLVDIANSPIFLKDSDHKQSADMATSPMILPVSLEAQLVDKKSSQMMPEDVFDIHVDKTEIQTDAAPVEVETKAAIVEDTVKVQMKGETTSVITQTEHVTLEREERNTDITNCVKMATDGSRSRIDRIPSLYDWALTILNMHKT